MNNNVEMKNAIVSVFRKYFECDDFGHANPEYWEGFSAQDALEEIHEIIGDFYASNCQDS